MPRFAANITWMFNEYDFVDRFAAAVALGFRAAECQFPYQWEPGVLASALCMDKVAAKNHLAAHGLPQAAYCWLTVDDDAHGGVRRPDGMTSSIEAWMTLVVSNETL